MSHYEVRNRLRRAFSQLTGVLANLPGGTEADVELTEHLLLTLESLQDACEHMDSNPLLELKSYDGEELRDAEFDIDA